MTKRVAIYARVSTKEQDCSRQLVELRQVAENHGWTVVEEYDDEGISGSTKSRPAVGRMLKAVISRKFEMVMTIELSRLGRSVANMCEIVELLKSKKIDLFCKNQNISTDTIIGEFSYNIINAVHQYQRDQIRKNVISGLENWKRKNPDKKLGRPSNLTPEVEGKILEMRSRRMGINKISKACGVGAQTIYKVLRTSEVATLSQSA